MTDINRSQQAGAGGAGWRSKPRRAFSIEQKHELVQLCLRPGASVARIARDHDINANQLFKWRRLHLRGQLGAGRDEGPRFMPVVVGDEPATAQSAPLTPEIECAVPPAPVRDGLAYTPKLAHRSMVKSCALTEHGALNGTLMSTDGQLSLTPYAGERTNHAYTSTCGRRGANPRGRHAGKSRQAGTRRACRWAGRLEPRVGGDDCPMTSLTV